MTILTTAQKIYLLCMAENAIRKTNCSKEHKHILQDGVITYLKRFDKTATDKECRRVFLKLNELVHSNNFSGDLEHGYVCTHTLMAVDNGKWAGKYRKKNSNTIDSAFITEDAISLISSTLSIDEESMNCWIERIEKELNLR